MSLETWQAKYPVYLEGEFENRTLREMLSLKNEKEPGSFTWSARLSTGIFGLPDCKSGNSSHAPKGANEVILAVGDEGLEQLIELGFIPCPTCHPENTSGFWERAEKAIKSNYPHLTDIYQFADKTKVPFDVRKVDWEKIGSFLTSLPNRLYVPEGLGEGDLTIIKARFSLLGFKLPPVGYYVNGAQWFKEYSIK